MEITDEVLIKIKEKFIEEELPEKLEDWTLSVPDGTKLCFIQQAITDFTETLHEVLHNNHIKEYNLQEIKEEQKLKQKVKYTKSAYKMTIEILNDQYEKDLDKIESEVLTALNSRFRQYKLLNDIQEKIIK